MHLIYRGEDENLDGNRNDKLIAPYNGDPYSFARKNAKQYKSFDNSISKVENAYLGFCCVRTINMMTYNIKQFSI